MVSTEKLELKHAEPFDVSFAEIQPDNDWKQTVQKVATAINVQFTECSQQDLPFVPFKEFQSLLREQKVFLFGLSGCGKSRTIIEFVRNNKRYNDRIDIISFLRLASTIYIGRSCNVAIVELLFH